MAEDLASKVGQDKPSKAATEQYDKEHGKYQDDDSAKPTAAPSSLPGALPAPFTIKG